MLNIGKLDALYFVICGNFQEISGVFGIASFGVGIRKIRNPFLQQQVVPLDHLLDVAWIDAVLVVVRQDLEKIEP